MWNVREEVTKQEYGWLSTLEYLPPFDREVLVCDRGEIKIGMLPTNGQWRSQDGLYRIPMEDLQEGLIKYWMHIPPVPGE